VYDSITVHPRVRQRHPEITQEDVAAAWRNKIVLVTRTFGPPDTFAAAGMDSKGRLLEMIGISMEDGSVTVYHAMKLTEKLRQELSL
jgi:hypothetical protein